MYVQYLFLLSLLTLKASMEKCRDCNATLKKEEKVCWSCGSAVKREEDGPALPGYLLKAATFMMYGSAAFTVASLFVSFTPGFLKCAITTLVLGIVRSSASQMVERKKI